MKRKNIGPSLRKKVEVESKDCWDKLGILADVFYKIFYFIFFVIASIFVTRTIKNKELEAKEFDLAVSIINSQNDTSNVANQQAKNDLMIWAYKTSYKRNIEHGTPQIGFMPNLPYYLGESSVTEVIRPNNTPFIDEESGIEIEIYNITNFDGVIRASGKITRPYGPKIWEDWQLPNKWDYVTSEHAYSVVVSNIENDTSKCEVSVYKIW